MPPDAIVITQQRKYPIKVMSENLRSIVKMRNYSDSIVNWSKQSAFTFKALSFVKILNKVPNMDGSSDGIQYTRQETSA
jgi:hypothetical protein